jgi:hypothetical protein
MIENPHIWKAIFTGMMMTATMNGALKQNALLCEVAMCLDANAPAYPQLQQYPLAYPQVPMQQPKANVDIVVDAEDAKRVANVSTNAV